jgi:predicted enzyme related to lactoylglutathione lyase
MIRGVHTMFYTSEPDKMRTFLRDTLGFAATDVGEGWLIFDLPEADMGCHPAEDEGAPSGTPHISFYCDDVEKTVADLKSRGVEFTEPVQNHGYGLVTFFRMPGNFTAQLYQPLYSKPSRSAEPAVAATPRKVRRAKKKAARVAARATRKAQKASGARSKARK